MEQSEAVFEPVAEGFGELFQGQLVLIFQPTFWHPCTRTPLFPADLAGFCPVDASLLLCLSS